MITNFGKNWHTHLLCTGIQQWMVDHNMDARINTTDDSSTSDKYLVNFGPIIREFCRHVCTGRATRWALPCISSLILLHCLLVAARF